MVGKIIEEIYTWNEDKQSWDLIERAHQGN